MRLSTIFELLLILLLVAFAAYGRVIDRDEAIHRVARAANNVKQSDIDLSTMSLKQATDSVNRYCTCNENICNCCRDFHIPLVQLKGPGCASLQYLQGDNLAVQLSFGDNILTSTIVNGKSPKPVCVPLPGGFTKFCGRIYSIQRDAKNHFKACLGLELQSPTELEATLRVSCFRFGPEGLKLRPAEPLPVIETDATSEEDDDDDFFGLGSDDDDDDDEDDERPITNSVPDASEVDDAQESDDDDDDDDPLGFSALLEIFTGDDDVPTRPKVTTATPLLEFTIPILPRPTTPAPLEDHELPTFINNEQENNYEEHDDNTQEPFKIEEEEENTGLTESNTEDNIDEQITESSNKIVYTARPDNAPTTNKVKKGVIGDKKKPTVTSTSVNAIHDPEKPAKKPIKDEDDEDDDEDDDILDDDDEDIDDEDDEILEDDDDDKDDEDEDEEDEDKLDDEKYEEHDDYEDEKAEDLADLDDDDDDDDEEENAMLSALIGTGKSKKSKENTKTNQTSIHKHDNEDYGFGLGFLARKRHSSENRQSKITRL